MAKTKNEDLTPLEIGALNTESVEKQESELFNKSKEEEKQEETINTESVEIKIDYPTDNVISNTNDVQFLVKYPSDYVGKKWFKDGVTIITSKESAAKFVNQKIGKIL